MTEKRDREAAVRWWVMRDAWPTYGVAEKRDREAAVRWWVGPTCRLDEGVLAWCGGDDSVHVGSEVVRLSEWLAQARAEGYRAGVEEAARVCEAAEKVSQDDERRSTDRTARMLAEERGREAGRLCDDIRALARDGGGNG